MTTQLTVPEGLSPDLRLESEVARRAAAAAGFSPDAEVRLLTTSENATYLAQEAGPGSRCNVIRVHRLNYHDRPAIEAELAWLEMIKRRSSVRVAAAVPLLAGGHVHEEDHPDGTRRAVVFEFVDGHGMEDVDLRREHFTMLGAIAAQLHHQVEFAPHVESRFSWDWKHTMGDEPRWGRWQDGPGLLPDHESVIDEALVVLEKRLRAYGTARDRYGLIHSDLRMANLIESGEEITVIDFDDCGNGWYMYDFASSVTFLETDERLEDFAEAWIEGYRAHRALRGDDLDMLPDMVLLRRLMMLAWLGSHPHAAEATTQVDDYAAGTARLAQQYLDGTLMRRNR